MSKPRKGKVDRRLIVPIIGDAAIAGRPADGRLLPVLLLDTSARPEIDELLRVHSYLPAGDVASQWAISRDDDDVVYLLLRFSQPMDVELVLSFSIEHQAMLVDTMLVGGGVYLQAGSPGDRLVTTMNHPRVLVELPDTDFASKWEEVLFRRLTAVLARRLGTSPHKARPHAERLIGQMRAVSRFRLPG